MGCLMPYITLIIPEKYQLRRERTVPLQEAVYCHHLILLNYPHAVVWN